MNYPSINEYKEAILFAEDNFEQLKNLRPVLDEEGSPVMTSGNFAVVFKMKDEQTGKLYAVKCFLREQEGRAEAYRMIADELEYVSSTLLTPIKYLDKELFVDTNAGDEKEFSVLLMDWVEGETLDKYIRKHLDDQYELSLLAYQFSRLAMWLMPQPFAHGDLKPDNILVKSDGTLVLVDYDGMYVPAMKGRKARELGSPDFRHPSRTEIDFDEHIDDFSLASILLSLKAISLQPSLLEEYGASDRLLFSEKDYRNLSGSKVMDALKSQMQDTELATLYSLFILSSAQNSLSQASFRLLKLSRPQSRSNERPYKNGKEMSSANTWMDKYVDLGLSVKWATCNIGANKPEEYGDYFKWGYYVPENKPSLDKLKKTNISYNSKYNVSDRKKVLTPEDDTATVLLGCPWRMPTIEEFKELKEKCVWKEEYLNGVKGCRVSGINGNSIFLPFADCDDVDIPFNSGTYWSSTAYTDNYLTFDNSWLITFKSERPIISFFYRSCANPIRPVILEDENLSTKMTDEDFANAWADEFGVMYSLDRRRLLKVSKELWEKESWEYSIREGTKVICDGAFCLHENFYHNGHISITIPNSVVKIGHAAFKGLSLSTIVIPNSVKEIVGNPFICNKGLVSIKVDKGNNIYDSRNDCNAIIDTHNNILISGCYKTQIPNCIREIGNEAFKECLELTDITIPDGILNIGAFSFSGCESLKSIIIPQSINEIKDKAFEYCEFESIAIPDNVNIIGDDIFYGCRMKRIYSSEEVKERIIKRTPEYEKYFDETVSTKYDFSNAYEDELGAKYSADKKRLLSIPNKLKEYIVKEGIEYICNYAFVGGSKRLFTSDDEFNLTIIFLPRSIKGVGKSAFVGCKKITSICIPIGTTFKFERLIPEYKDLLIEQDVEENLCTEVSKEDLSNAWTDEFGVKYSSDRRRLLRASNVTDNYSIKAGTIVICDKAFSQCHKLQSVQIPNSVTTIGDFAFYNCVKLYSVIVPKSVINMGMCVFEGCERLPNYHPFE